MQATIKYPSGKSFPSKHDGQPRVNVVVVLPDGGEVRIYGSPDELGGYRKGDRLTLTQDGKGGYKIVSNQPPQAQTQPQDPLARKAEIAQYIVDSAKLYSFAYSRARDAMPPDATEAAIQACASSIFIAVGRKFGL